MFLFDAHEEDMSRAEVGQSSISLTVRMEHGFNVFSWSWKGKQRPGLGTFFFFF